MTETEANDLKSSHLWEAVVRELNYRIFGKLLTMKTCEPDKVSALQSQIAVYEELIALPEGVLDRESTKGT